jgi:GNAT superfamily N-acetyltransferase
MTIRSAQTIDAEPVSQLIRGLSSQLLVSPSGAGAELYFASISPSAIAQYVLEERYVYLVHEGPTGVRAVVGLRDNQHLFHLFVDREHQRSGIGTRLWKRVRDQALALGNPGRFTVNASLDAQAFYTRLGFRPTSALIQAHGVEYVPMKLDLHTQQRSHASC